MSENNVKIEGYSIIGDRTSQQDALQYRMANGILFAAVCDGMGGMAGGEQASRLAIASMFRTFEAAPPAEAGIPAWLREQFLAADREVSALTDRQGNPLRAGTTVVAVMIVSDRLYWGSVGDSRIYYLEKENLITLTRMHNYNLRLDELVNSGEMTPEERVVESNAQGEALISFLGIGNPPLVDVTERPRTMRKGDVVVLCSDGLYKSLDDHQIRAIIEETGGSMRLASRRLCEEALRLSVRKQDNTTIIAIRYRG